jgi:hypothetical protein
MAKAQVLALRPAVSQFLRVLSDLVNPGERGLAALQVLLARVDVGLLRERRVIVTRPLADDRDRHGPHRHAHSLRPRSRDNLPDRRPVSRRRQQELSPDRPRLPHPPRPGRPNQLRRRADKPRPWAPQVQPVPDHPGHDVLDAEPEQCTLVANVTA